MVSILGLTYRLPAFSEAEWTSRGALGALISALAFLLPATYWWFRLRRIRNRLEQIPIRILVTGSRGKSSLVRHLHSVFYHAGYTVYAKTTGTAAAEIDARNIEVETKRFGQVCVLEIVETAERAERSEPQLSVLIFECMAVSPKLISLVARLMVRPTVVVITNSLFDHLEEEGRTHVEIAYSLTEAIVEDTQLVITADHDDRNLQIYQAAAAKFGAEYRFADYALISEQALAANPRLHPDNVAMTSEISKFFNLTESDLFAGLTKTTSEKSDRKIFDVQRKNVLYRFFDFGSINDTESLSFAWKDFDSKSDSRAYRIALLVNRWDRPLRAISFAANVDPVRFNAICLVGELDGYLYRELISLGWNENQILHLAGSARFIERWAAQLDNFVHNNAPDAALVEICLLENIHNPLADVIRESIESEVK